MLNWEKTENNTKQQKLLLMCKGDLEAQLELLETSNSQNIQHKSPFLDRSLEAPTQTVVLGPKVSDQRLALPPKPKTCTHRGGLPQEPVLTKAGSTTGNKHKEHPQNTAPEIASLADTLGREDGDSTVPGVALASD